VFWYSSPILPSPTIKNFFIAKEGIFFENIRFRENISAKIKKKHMVLRPHAFFYVENNGLAL